MKIEYKNYIIENDKDFSFILKRIEPISDSTKERIAKMGVESKNETTIVVLGYFANLEQVFIRMLRDELLLSDTSTFEQLNQKLDSIYQELREFKENRPHD